MDVDVSVVVPALRRPVSLRRAVESALGQLGPSVDVLVVDVSPESSAAAVVRALKDRRVSYLKRSVPGAVSLASARNEAWPRVHGRCLHFMEEDDVVAPGAYAALTAALDAQPERGVAFGRVDPYSEDLDLLVRERQYFERAARTARW